MAEIVIASRNPGKRREIKSLLAWPGGILSLEDFPDLPELEETGATFAENALEKAGAVARLTGRVAMADDSGLMVDALQGRPGVRSARYGGEEATDRDKYKRILEEMVGVAEENRQARFVCAMAIVSPDGEERVVEGEVRGRIALEPRGEGGFGYDPIFLLPELGRTMAELAPEEKNRLSHRARALEKLKAILPEFLKHVRCEK